MSRTAATDVTKARATKAAATRIEPTSAVLAAENEGLSIPPTKAVISKAEAGPGRRGRRRSDYNAYLARVGRFH